MKAAICWLRNRCTLFGFFLDNGGDSVDYHSASCAVPFAEVLKLPFLELASSGLFAGSSCAKHEAGPSQGSVVGPGSFNIFIGDLEEEAEAHLSNL